MKNSEAHLLEKISIIIPIYNAEKYISRCLDSILHQEYENIEIICVNDGSKDNSLNLLIEYQNKDSRVIVVDKKNEGVSIARNTGMQRSTGKYIMFVDADDYMVEDALITISKHIQKNVDLIKFDYNIVSSMGQATSINISKSSKFMKKEELENFVINTGHMHSVWNNVYIADIIRLNNIEFPAGIIMAEDLFFNLKYFSKVDNWYYIRKPLYNYYLNENSVSFDLSEIKFDKKVKDTVTVYKEIFNLTTNKEQLPNIERKLLYAYNNEIRNIIFVKNKKDKIKYIRENTNALLSNFKSINKNELNLETKLLLNKKYILYYLYLFILRNIKRIIKVNKIQRTRE